MTAAQREAAVDLAAFLSQNNCRSDQVFQGAPARTSILGGLLPVPVAFADDAEQLVAIGMGRLLAVTDLDRVQRLNVLGWVQPTLDAQGQLQTVDSVPALLWNKWRELAGNEP